jgi:hypothetical protein
MRLATSRCMRSSIALSPLDLRVVDVPARFLGRLPDSLDGAVAVLVEPCPHGSAGATFLWTLDAVLLGAGGDPQRSPDYGGTRSAAGFAAGQGSPADD